MNSTLNACDSDKLDACLQGTLTAASLAELEQHLEGCRRCREQLEQRAASKDDWSEAEQWLQDETCDVSATNDDWFPSFQDDRYRQLIAALRPSDDPRMLGRLGPFEIAGIIGSGGMGIVLKAFDPSLSRFVALKVLSVHLWNDEEARSRFSRESRAAASVIHENVIEIYGVSEENGIPYFAMPYLRGETLQQRIVRQGPLGLEEILRVSKQLAEGLAAAHAQGVVHRDIKPANVMMVDGADRVCLTDFGLARSDGDDQVTRSGMLAGTPVFMSPEQVKGRPLDARSDLFSLGSVIYTMCTGAPPFGGDSSFEQMAQVTAGNPTRLETINSSLPTWLAAIVDRLHRVSPDDRYQTASELAADLEKCLAHTQNPASCLQPQNVTRLQKKYVRRAATRRRKPQLAAGGLLLFSAIALFWLWPTLFSPQAPADSAENQIAVSGRVVNDSDQPLADATVLAIQKTWPNNRYRQRSLKTTTDEDGNFRLDQFARRGEQYAFLLTALPDDHAMTSLYRVVEDGSPQEPVTLKVKPSTPVTVRVVDENGEPIRGVKVLPDSRTTPDGEEFMTYSIPKCFSVSRALGRLAASVCNDFGNRNFGSVTGFRFVGSGHECVDLNRFLRSHRRLARFEERHDLLEKRGVS